MASGDNSRKIFSSVCHLFLVAHSLTAVAPLSYWSRVSLILHLAFISVFSCTHNHFASVVISHCFDFLRCFILLSYLLSSHLTHLMARFC